MSAITDHATALARVSVCNQVLKTAAQKAVGQKTEGQKPLFQKTAGDEALASLWARVPPEWRAPLLGGLIGLGAGGFTGATALSPRDEYGRPRSRRGLLAGGLTGALAGSSAGLWANALGAGYPGDTSSLFKFSSDDTRSRQKVADNGGLSGVWANLPSSLKNTLIGGAAGAGLGGLAGATVLAPTGPDDKKRRGRGFARGALAGGALGAGGSLLAGQLGLSAGGDGYGGNLFPGIKFGPSGSMSDQEFSGLNPRKLTPEHVGRMTQEQLEKLQETARENANGGLSSRLLRGLGGFTGMQAWGAIPRGARSLLDASPKGPGASIYSGLVHGDKPRVAEAWKIFRQRAAGLNAEDAKKLQAARSAAKDFLRSRGYYRTQALQKGLLTPSRGGLLGAAGGFFLPELGGALYDAVVK